VEINMPIVKIRDVTPRWSNGAPNESSGIGVQSRVVTVKPEEWGDFLKCPDYRTCYDLGMARLQLWQSLQNFD